MDGFKLALTSGRIVSVYVGESLPESKAYSIECLFDRKKYHELAFEVCYDILAIFPNFDFYRIGENVSVPRFSPSSKFGILEFSDSMNDFFVIHMANALIGYLSHKGFRTFGLNDFCA